MNIQARYKSGVGSDIERRPLNIRTFTTMYPTHCNFQVPSGIIPVGTSNNCLENFSLDGNGGALSTGVKLSIDNAQIGNIAKTRKPVRVRD